MTEKAVCNKCGAEYTDAESIELAKKWTADGYAPCPNLGCRGQLEIKQLHRQLAIKGSFTSRQPDGTNIGIEFHGVVDSQIGSTKEVAAVVLEGEMHGNDGKTRVHLFLQ